MLTVQMIHLVVLIGKELLLLVDTLFSGNGALISSSLFLLETGGKEIVLLFCRSDRGEGSGRGED